MLALSAIQSTVAAAIAANEYIAQALAVSVITDDGLQDREIEVQLRTRGCLVVVPPVVRAVRRDKGGRTLLMDAEIAVRVAVNPQVNAQVGGAQRNVYLLVQAVAKAVMDWTPAPGDYRFEVAEEWLQLVTNDPGLIAYELSFAKSASIN